MVQDEPERRSGSEDPGETAYLARAVQRGDLARFEELYARVAPALHAWASLRSPRSVDPGDLLGEIWLCALQSLETHDAGNHEFRAWIFGVAKNVLLRELRDLPRARMAGAGDPSASSRGALERQPAIVTSICARLARDDSLSAFLERARGFEPIDRDLLVHCGLEGYTCAQAAVRLGVSTDAATKRWQRLRAELRASAWVRDLLVDSD